MAMTSVWRAGALAIIFLVPTDPGARAVAQENLPRQDSSRTHRSYWEYEATKKDKGSALALALLVPGGGVFYAGGHPEYAVGIGMIEAASLGGVLYLLDQLNRGTAVSGDRGMTTALFLMYGVCKILEVTHAFDLIDRQNAGLWRKLFGPEGEPGAYLHLPAGGITTKPDISVTIRFCL